MTKLPPRHRRDISHGETIRRLSTKAPSRWVINTIWGLMFAATALILVTLDTGWPL